MKSKNIDDLVAVYRAEGPLDGEMVKGFLEAQGIPAMLSQDTIGKLYGLTQLGGLGEAYILVDPENEDKARELLLAMEGGEFSEESLKGVSEAPTKAEDAPLDEIAAYMLPGIKKLLFLCTGNSCRSQIAEAIVNFDLADQWQAYSAGTDPADYMHPLAIKALEEVGIVHEGEPKSIDALRGEQFDLVITVCDHARDTCPTWLDPCQKLHIGYPDPAAVRGDEQTRMEAYRETVAKMRKQIPELLAAY
jgi:arsenate reductase